MKPTTLEFSGHPDVRVHIERLVLTGVAVTDRSALALAVESKLTQLFAESGWRGVPTEAIQAARVDGGVISTPARNSDADLGARIAAAVHGGLAR